MAAGMASEVTTIDKNRVAKSELTKLWAIFGLHIWSGTMI